MPPCPTRWSGSWRAPWKRTNSITPLARRGKRNRAGKNLWATDRVGAEVMGVDANWLGWMKYCGEAGVGQWDLSRIDVRGEKIAAVQKKYRLHPDIDLQLRWMGPMEELPPNLGWVRPVTDYIPV